MSKRIRTQEHPETPLAIAASRWIGGSCLELIHEFNNRFLESLARSAQWGPKEKMPDILGGSRTSLECDGCPGTVESEPVPVHSCRPEVLRCRLVAKSPEWEASGSHGSLRRLVPMDRWHGDGTRRVDGCVVHCPGGCLPCHPLDRNVRRGCRGGCEIQPSPTVAGRRSRASTLAPALRKPKCLLGPPSERSGPR